MQTPNRFDVLLLVIWTCYEHLGGKATRGQKTPRNGVPRCFPVQKPG